MIVVSDASPLIGLGKINQLDLLSKLFQQIIIPPAVEDECVFYRNKPGADAILSAIKKKDISVHHKPIDLVANLSKVLGPGEIEAISLAVKINRPLLIDERKGRIAAKQQDVNIIGTGGVLIAAKQQQIISKIQPVLDDLIQSGYRISDRLRAQILTYDN